jgi:hypothetical protein
VGASRRVYFGVALAAAIALALGAGDAGAWLNYMAAPPPGGHGGLPSSGSAQQPDRAPRESKRGSHASDRAPLVFPATWRGRASRASAMLWRTPFVSRASPRAFTVPALSDVGEPR